MARMSVHCAVPGRGRLALEDSVTLATLEALKENEELAQMDKLLLPADTAVTEAAIGGAQ